MRPILSLINLFVGMAIYSIPNMTRRSILFAVPVAPGFRESSIGRRSLFTFRVLVAAATVAGLLAILLTPGYLIEPTILVQPLLILLAGGLGFAWQNRRLTPFAVQPPQTREAEVSNEPDRVPWFTWLGAGPFVILAIAAAYLTSNWERIPVRFAVHWGADGHPNRWSERTVQGVYGPILFAGEICIWLLMMALAGWFGARRSRFRRVTFGGMIATEYMIGLLLAAISIGPLVRISLWAIMLGPLLFTGAMLFVMARKVAEPGEAAEPTPNECWKAGVIYYNPDDAALMVEKRTGLGYTMNFGNGWSWVLLAGMVVVVGSAFVLL